VADAPVDTIAERIAQRRADASDATAGLVRKSGAFKTGEIAWRRIDASPGPERVADAALAAVRDTGGF